MELRQAYRKLGGTDLMVSPVSLGPVRSVVCLVISASSRESI